MTFCLVGETGMTQESILGALLLLLRTMGDDLYVSFLAEQYEWKACQWSRNQKNPPSYTVLTGITFLELLCFIRF